MTKRVLFLDDRSKRLHAALKKYAPPEFDLTLVCTVKECIKMISNEPRWDIVSLDHDLGFEEFVDYDSPHSGMVVINWLIKNYKQLRTDKRWPDTIYIHTSNRMAGHFMEDSLIRLEKLFKWPVSVFYMRFEYE